jgi:N-succinyldiaminopimelate aminotransferase
VTFNNHFADLQQYPFEKLRALTANITPSTKHHHIPLSLGEPKHAPPGFVLDALTDRTALTTQLSTYPATKGSDELRGAISAWVDQRFHVTVDPDTQVLPVSGTREALFSFAQAMLSGKPDSKVLLPNPFYQIYEGAALLAGAEAVFVDNQQRLGYQQDFSTISEATWRQTELLYLCSPGNPTGQIMSITQLQQLITLAHKYDFYIASDECYSELYFDDNTKPPSLLNASAQMGNPDYARCVIFHSLSKRSNLPGIRSGFVAGDASLMSSYLKYRTYHGCALPPHHQHASALAWADERHVEENRQLYRRKFTAVSSILAPVYALTQPDGGFYHWLPTPIDDQLFCQQLLEKYNVTVMPGSFLARSSSASDDAAESNPGNNHVRVAWVAPIEDCVEAAQRLADFGKQL